MELKEYFEAVTRRWAWVVGSLAVAVALALGYLAVTPATHTARSDLFLSATTDSGDSLVDLSRYSQLRAKSYAETVDTPAVLQPVIDDLGLDTTVTDLAWSVEAGVPLETVVLTLSVTREDPAEAVAIAEALDDSMVTLINSVEGEGPDALEATILAEAQLDPSPTSPDRLMTLAAATVLGLAAGLGLALFRQARDSVVRSTDTVRQVVTRAAESAAPLRVHTSEDMSSRVSFVDSSAVPTYLCAQKRSHLLVYVLHCGMSNDLTGMLVRSASGLTGDGSSVCLVDADASHQPLSKWAGEQAAPGWTDLVAGRATREAALRVQADLPLTLVFSGDPISHVDLGRFSTTLLQIHREHACTILLAGYEETRLPPGVVGEVDVVMVWVEQDVSSRHALEAQLKLALAAQSAEVAVVIAGSHRSRGRHSR